MPKTTRMTPEERRASKFKRAILRLCEDSEFGSLSEVCYEIGETYDSVWHALDRGTIKARTVGQIIKAVDADAETVHKLMRM